jgi:arylsulfatase A-like enzyme
MLWRAGVILMRKLFLSRSFRPVWLLLVLVVAVRGGQAGAQQAPVATQPSAAKGAQPGAGAAGPQARHVVLVVMDGLRPDSVTAADMPTLHALAAEGTFFAAHHPVYCSTTEVNGTAIATGAYPEHSGVIANHEYRPAIDATKAVDTETAGTIIKGDQATGGHYLGVATVPEILQAAGLRTIVAGTKPVANLFDRTISVKGLASATGSVCVIQGQANPASALGVAGNPQGVFPPVADTRKVPNAGQDRWTTQVLIDQLWKDGVPPYTVLWLSDPDFTQHGAGVGSGPAKAALKSVDDDLGRVLKALDERGQRDQTDVLVVSDHGFSTIDPSISLVDVLRDAGFDAARSFDQGPKNGQVLADALGGSAYLYVGGHDAAVTQKLVDFLEGSDFAGVVMTRQALPGTFTLEQAGIASPGAPDVVVSGRWSDKKNAAGVAGSLACFGGRVGLGMHGSLSRFDMHNTLIAAGPDIRRGFTDSLPSGNIDVAPTILFLLGQGEQAAKMDGRVLGEAMVNWIGGNGGEPKTTVIEAANLAAKKPWTQYLKVTRLGKSTYIDEGNCGAAPDGAVK